MQSNRSFVQPNSVRLDDRFLSYQQLIGDNPRHNSRVQSSTATIFVASGCGQREETRIWSAVAVIFYIVVTAFP